MKKSAVDSRSVISDTCSDFVFFSAMKFFIGVICTVLKVLFSCCNTASDRPICSYTDKCKRHFCHVQLCELANAVLIHVQDQRTATYLSRPVYTYI